MVLRATTLALVCASSSAWVCAADTPKASQATPADAAGYAARIEALRTAGAFIDAMLLARQGAQAFPQDRGIALLTVDILLQLKDPASALALLDRIGPGPGSDLLRARAFEALGRWAGAYGSYALAATATPSSAAANAGRQRALQHAAKLDKWLVFAPAGWTPLPGRAALRHIARGVEVALERQAGADADASAKAVVAARLPSRLLQQAPVDVMATIAAKIAEHRTAAPGHFHDVPEQEMSKTAELLQSTPLQMGIEVEPAGTPLASYARSVANRAVAPGTGPEPVYGLARRDVPLVFIVTRIDEPQARALLLELAAAGVVQE